MGANFQKNKNITLRAALTRGQKRDHCMSEKTNFSEIPLFRKLDLLSHPMGESSYENRLYGCAFHKMGGKEHLEILLEKATQTVIYTCEHLQRFRPKQFSDKEKNE